ncbi:MAG: hypothetical protein A2505_02870 [Deltaproteobacteria bacterium RIFOXYD12_FULL_55_16]|nr:MAG: hypothetical protein A2505_02870 [Deltaproteobacteria bacterium RIFOXYD12_FULL_55_16]
MRKWKVLLCLMCVGFLAACVAKQANLPHDAGSLATKLKQGYVQKVETALFVLDGSESMSESYQENQKFSIAQNLLLRMNTAIAGLKLDAGLHVFGPIMGANRQDSKLVYGMKAYDSVELAAAVTLAKTDGVTPLASPLTESIETLKTSKGRIAVIVVSDGMNTEKANPLQAAEELKKAYGDRLCIYTVLIGNNPAGKAAMQAIATAGGCGFATTAEALVQGSDLADFLEKVFLEKAPAPAPVVPPKPEPPKPEPPKPPVVVERVVLRGINFDFDKAVVKPEFAPVLDVAAGILKARPGLKVVVEGHTCNMGSEAYNQKLSERRAKAVKVYLVQKGVKAENLSTAGHGEMHPMADNRKKSGRELNRRVEFKIMQ